MPAAGVIPAMGWNDWPAGFLDRRPDPLPVVTFRIKRRAMRPACYIPFGKVRLKPEDTSSDANYRFRFFQMGAVACRPRRARAAGHWRLLALAAAGSRPASQQARW